MIGHHFGRNRCPIYGIAGWLLFSFIPIAAMEMQSRLGKCPLYRGCPQFRGGR